MKIVQFVLEFFYACRQKFLAIFLSGIFLLIGVPTRFFHFDYPRHVESCRMIQAARDLYCHYVCYRHNKAIWQPSVSRSLSGLEPAGVPSGVSKAPKPTSPRDESSTISQPSSSPPPFPSRPVNFPSPISTVESVSDDKKYTESFKTTNSLR